MKSKLIKDYKDWILIIGIILAPMTYLRIWKIGPAEILCAIWAVIHVKDMFKINLKNNLTKFWVSFLVILFLGTCYGALFYPQELIVTDLLSYIFFAIISLSIYSGLIKKEYKDIKNIYLCICIISILWYMFLYLYGKYIAKSFFSIPLLYGNKRFAGGGTNPHQLAIMIGCCFFGVITQLIQEKNTKFKNIVYFVLCICCIIISKATESSTLIMSIILAGIIGSYICFINHVQGKKQKIYMTMILLFIMILIVMFFGNKLYQFIFNWISSDENGIGRIEIFKTINIVLKKNWLIGIGPGIHAFNGKMEFHNTYLEIIAMSGLAGFFIFIRFSVKLIKNIFREPILILPIIIIYSYGLAGFAFRRLCYWAFLTTIMVISEKCDTNKRKEKNKNVNYRHTAI